MPSMDLDLGFCQVAKHYYFPGWYQQATVGELLVNREQWEMLTDQHKAILNIAYGDSLNWSFVRSEALQYKAMLKLMGNDSRGARLYARAVATALAISIIEK